MDISGLLQPFVIVYKEFINGNTLMVIHLWFGHPNKENLKLVWTKNYSRIFPFQTIISQVFGWINLIND